MIGEKEPEKNLNDFNFLLSQFYKESDRAAVILIVSIIDNLLETLLKSYLVPNPSSSDSLFDNPTSPLANLNSKIDILFRIGLISSKFSRDLHLIRKVRNSFAHDIYGCDFEDGSVKSRIRELKNSFSKAFHDRLKMFKTNNIPGLTNGARGEFLLIGCLMIFRLNNLIDKKVELCEQELEWFYLDQSIQELDKEFMKGSKSN